MGEINTIIYFKADLIAESPLTIGGGIDDNTDSDILRNSDGEPYIPGTTLTGICRHYFAKKFGKDVTEKVFGSTASKENKTQKNSDIIFYDAPLKTNNKDYVISNRDGVRLDENKNTIPGGKFDYEIIEAGSVFDFKLELLSENDTTQIIDNIVNGFNSHEIRIGAKTTRGFGKFKTSVEKIKKINLQSQIQEYIDFSWESITDIYSCPKMDATQYETWKISFELSSFLFIRNYMTTAQVYDPEKEKVAGKIVDAEQLLNKDGNSVIPGTSWAGAFRRQFKRILKKVNYSGDVEELTNNVFGDVDKDENFKPSKIIFSESVIEGSHQLNRTRNAIDRFTGGAGDKKLFTTRPTYEGCGTLEIKLLKPNADSIGEYLTEEDFILAESTITACIDDLKNGLLTIGGETSTGGGLIKVVREENLK